LERITTDNTQTSLVTVNAPPAEFPLFLVIGIVVAVAVIVAVIFYLKRRPKKPKPPRLKLSANPPEILADGKSTSTIKVELVDEKGAVVPAKEDTAISLTSTDGRMSTSVTIPKGQSAATTTITSSTNIGSVGIAATSKGLKDTKGAVTFKEKKRYCMHCGEVMAYTARVCSKCGRTPPAGVDTKVCRNCTSVIPIVAKFCSECGASQPESTP
jgi:RNA polymerase subunit RPABC4/transcription elongation factor Spt4